MIPVVEASFTEIGETLIPSPGDRWCKTFSLYGLKTTIGPRRAYRSSIGSRPRPPTATKRPSMWPPDRLRVCLGACSSLCILSRRPKSVCGSPVLTLFPTLPSSMLWSWPAYVGWTFESLFQSVTICSLCIWPPLVPFRRSSTVGSAFFVIAPVTPIKNVCWWTTTGAGWGVPTSTIAP